MEYKKWHINNSDRKNWLLSKTVPYFTAGYKFLVYPAGALAPYHVADTTLTAPLFTFFCSH
jgi:hypothetical protein